MLNLPTIADLTAAAESVTRKDLQKLLAERLADTIKCGLQDLTHVLVVESGDTEQQIIDAVGHDPLVTRIDQVRNSLDFDWIERHPGWWELLRCVGNDFAYILLVEDADDVPLAQLCRKEGPSQ